MPEKSPKLMRGSRVAYKKIFGILYIPLVMYATVGSGCMKAKGLDDPQLQVAFCLTVLNPK